MDVTEDMAREDNGFNYCEAIGCTDACGDVDSCTKKPEEFAKAHECEAIRRALSCSMTKDGTTVIICSESDARVLRDVINTWLPPV